MSSARSQKDTFGCSVLAGTSGAVSERHSAMLFRFAFAWSARNRACESCLTRLRVCRHCRTPPHVSVNKDAAQGEDNNDCA